MTNDAGQASDRSHDHSRSPVVGNGKWILRDLADPGHLGLKIASGQYHDVPSKRVTEIQLKETFGK